MEYSEDEDHSMQNHSNLYIKNVEKFYSCRAKGEVGHGHSDDFSIDQENVTRNHRIKRKFSKINWEIKSDFENFDSLNMEDHSSDDQE